MKKRKCFTSMWLTQELASKRLTKSNYLKCSANCSTQASKTSKELVSGSTFVSESLMSIMERCQSSQRSVKAANLVLGSRSSRFNLIKLKIVPTRLISQNSNHSFYQMTSLPNPKTTKRYNNRISKRSLPRKLQKKTKDQPQGMQKQKSKMDNLKANKKLNRIVRRETQLPKKRRVREAKHWSRRISKLPRMTCIPTWLSASKWRNYTPMRACNLLEWS